WPSRAAIRCASPSVPPRRRNRLRPPRCAWRWRPRRAACRCTSSSGAAPPIPNRWPSSSNPAPRRLPHLPTMRLWIAVFLRCLPLDAARPQWPPDAAFAVADQERLAALTPAAAAAGLQPGMRRAGAAAIAPQVSLLARDPAAETRLLHEAALALLQYTPEVALAGADAVLLQVGASLAYFGGPRALHRRIAATLGAMGLHARLGMAPTAQGAWLLARQPRRGAPRRALRLATLARRLDALPCELLPCALPRRDWLHDIGCRTLGALRRLPRAGLQRRCGTELPQVLDAAYGAAPECHAWIQPPARFRQRLELPDYIEHAEAVLSSARRLLEQLCGWLAALRRAV